MKTTQLKESLANAPETKVKVSLELHRDIMRAVKLAEPVGKKPAFYRVMPAMGAAILAVFSVGMFFYLSQTTAVAPLTTTDQGLSQTQSPVSPLEQLAGELLVLSKNTPLPEQELRKELERLKSDLERFDFRS